MNISRDPPGYRVPYGLGYPAWDPSASRAQKPPGTRRESRKGPAKDAMHTGPERQPTGLTGWDVTDCNQEQILQIQED